MKEHLTTKHKVAFLKQKLNDHNTSTKVQNEILDLFIGFYTKEDFEIMVFFKELDRIVNKLYKGG